ncbi:MAG: MIP/aquaporin family protein [Paracoccaceae bacterium]
MRRRLFAEFLGTLFLLSAIVGSGIMAERLAGGNVAITLLANSISTGAMLVVLILMFGPISGAHFNPAVTLAFAIKKDIRGADAVLYVVAQIAGGVIGVMLANLMFELPLISASTTARGGTGQWIGEVVASFGLIATILACLKFRAGATPYAVGLYITSAFWFTSSTSFANPAVSVGRALSDSFAGIAPADVAAFVVMQLIGAVLAVLSFNWLLGDAGAVAAGDDRKTS